MTRRESPGIWPHSTPDNAYARATAALREFMRAPSPASPGMMSMVDPGRIRHVLTDAGFGDVSLTSVETTEVLGRDTADAADFICRMPAIRFNLPGLDHATGDRVRDEVRAGLRPYETPRGVGVPGAVRLVTATRR